MVVIKLSWSMRALNVWQSELLIAVVLSHCSPRNSPIMPLTRALGVCINIQNSSQLCSKCLWMDTNEMKEAITVLCRKIIFFAIFIAASLEWNEAYRRPCLHLQCTQSNKFIINLTTSLQSDQVHGKQRKVSSELRVHGSLHRQLPVFL